MGTAMSLNAEITQQLGYIANNETAKKRLLKYLKRLVVQTKEVEEYRPRTKAELLADFDQACKELKLSLEGKVKLMSLEEALNEL